MASWTQLVFNPSTSEAKAEQAYWTLEDMRAEVCAWEVSQIEVQFDFRTWPMADLLDELDMVLALAPDQEDVIEELRSEVARRQGGTA